MSVRALALAASLLLCLSASAQVPPSLSGSWAGAVMEGTTPKLFTLVFSTNGDSLTTTLVQPYNGYETFDYAFTYAPPAGGSQGDGTLTAGLFGDMRLLVDLKEMNLRGTLSRGDSVVATVFLQKVIDVPLPRIVEREFQVVSGRDTLAGALIRPDEPEARGQRHPTVVLVTGRGYGGRWEMSWLARLYARNGIAAVVWDGRGQGRSTGNGATVTSAQRIADVTAVLDWTLHQPEVDPDQVGVHGSSAGGWFAPLAIDGREDVAFFISDVGPAEPLDAQQGDTTTELMHRSDSTYTDAEYDDAFTYQRDLVRMAQRGATWPKYEAVNATARAARWGEHALIPDSLTSSDLDYYARMPGLDPRPALSRWRKPMLAVLGSEDWIVPSRENAERFRQLAEEAGNDALTVAVLTMGHARERAGAVIGEGTWPTRYRRDWTRVPEYFDTLLEWLDEHTTTAAERQGLD